MDSASSTEQVLMKDGRVRAGPRTGPRLGLREKTRGTKAKVHPEQTEGQRHQHLYVFVS